MDESGKKDTPEFYARQCKISREKFGACIQPCENTDRELWREREGDYYADSIHVTEAGEIGINCGGLVIVMPLRKWHKLARKDCDLPDSIERFLDVYRP